MVEVMKFSKIKPYGHIYTNVKEALQVERLK